MYRTCLFCSRDLGDNTVVESLPIGRRLAFDAAQGRLWVICHECERWNLVPFDTRLETIDVCDRLFRGTRLRFSTDNIGIARLGEGLELVRIGSAERSEYAAWRYGDQFGRRRKRAFMVGAAGVLAIGGVYAGGMALGVSAAAIPNMINIASSLYAHRSIAARIPERDGVGGVLSHAGLKAGRICATEDDGWELSVRLRPDVRGRWIPLSRDTGRLVTLRGDHAMAALGQLLPALNAGGAGRKVVSQAVTLVEQRNPEQLLQGNRDAWRRDKTGRRGLELRKLGLNARLAMEMMLHEESERRALAGELRLLERQWREAEELAGIADALAVPESVDEELARLTAPTNGTPDARRPPAGS